MLPSRTASRTAPGPRDVTLRWTELAELVCRASRVLSANLADQAAPRGLSEAQFSLLWACGRGPETGLSQSELAALLQVSPAHVSGLVEQLRCQGLLAGERRVPDRRKQVWQLTAKGLADLDELIASLVTWAQQLERQLGAERRQELTTLLADLASAALAEPAAASVRVFAPQTPPRSEGQEGACS